MSTLYRKYINEMYIHGYTRSEDEPTFRVPENFDRYNEGSGWQAYQGANDWESGTTGVAIYLNPEGYNKEMARIWFEVKYPLHLESLVGRAISSGRPEYREISKWGKKAAVRWIREAEQIRKSTRQFHGVNDGYFREWVERKPWKECFILALQSERMKPFVKKYGVDHTKWVGMKRCELNESGIPSKFWWMTPEGELIPVPKLGHAEVGRYILKKKFRVETENIFTELQARGYIRVGFTGLWSQYFLEINHNKDKSPTATQWKALKDLAIEMGADSINDNTTGLQIRVDESRLLFENFHENKEWFVYEGSNTITTVFEDNSRQTFKLHFHNKRLREDRDKVRKKAASTWKKLAKEIRDSAGLSEAGNSISISWQECFQRALKHPDMLEFVDDLGAAPIFESFTGALEENTLTEMTYDELHQSMKNFRTRADLRKGTTTGSDSRDRGAKSVGVRSLRVISTVGKDGNEHETSTFSYKSQSSRPDARSSRPRWNGFIRFIENSKDTAVAPVKDKQDVEVNCNCPDYRYVWAKANSDVDAGVTAKDGGMRYHSAGGVPKQQNIFEAEQPSVVDVNRSGGFKGGNDNDGTYGKRIRNPNNVPGLCIAKGEFISTQRGFIPIEHVVVGDKVWTLDGWRGVINSGCTGKKKIVEVTTVSGKVIKLTPEHNVLSFNEKIGVRWVDAGSLTPDDFLCSTLPTDISTDSQYLDVSEYAGDKLYYPPTRVKLNNTLAELMGYMVAEGSKNGIFSNNKLSLLSRSDVSFEKVKGIKNNDTPTDVYDLKVDISEHFTVNGIVVHNCKHLIALADYIEKNTEPEAVAPAEPGKEEDPAVAKPSKLKKTGKPVNIFEKVKRFALANPTFDVPYEH